MRNDPDPRRHRTGRTAALAAFDRSLDGARGARTLRDAPPSPDQPPQRDGLEVAPAFLAFDLDGVRLDLQVRARGGLRDLSGLFQGDFDHVDARLRRPGATLSLIVGVDGRFVAADQPPGPVCLVVDRPGRPLTVTDWFTV
ncbi:MULTISPECIES: carboxypeptidase regulatory-like domain-containing protein [unclassified Nocardiopsis]|uniref:carboxypeptidase regulatory-like domain-containing protein n=1 Tax=unclassified Nocardiopsis TaxID=2649073 RepID=UPI003410FD74